MAAGHEPAGLVGAKVNDGQIDGEFSANFLEAIKIGCICR